MQASQENTSKGVKRKIEDVDVDELPEEHDEADTDARKKPKSRPDSLISHSSTDEQDQTQADLEDSTQAGKDVSATAPSPTTAPESGPPDERQPVPNGSGTAQGPADVDESEWAAFEAEVAPLAAAAPPDYASHTIVAAPVTATQMEAQAAEDGRRKLEVEADAEEEDEERRLEDEFEVMEEMEERVRKLREKREALKNATLVGADTGQGDPTAAADSTAKKTAAHQETQVPDNHEDEEDVDDEDDWYA